MGLGVPALALVGLLLAGVAAAAGEPPPAGGEGGPVVVELFTSQGCSSCPPADRLLSRLAAEPGTRGRVIALAFHVDYWNSLGWRDPFSSPRWSQRQHDYGRALGLDTVYTPQLVIGGRRECVGSREEDVRREIGRALAEPASGRVELTLTPAAATLRAAVRAWRVAPADGDPAVALVALVEDGLTTAVSRGENARRTLTNDRVVRRLERAFVLPAVDGAEGAGEVEFKLDPVWNRARLSVVAFLQDPDSRAILGATAAAAP